MVAPIVAAVIAPFLKDLFSNGLSLIGNAVIAKGQDVVEKELGVKIENTKPEVLLKLQQEHEEFLLNAAIKKQELDFEEEKAAQANVTERWKADMLSDSYLSKNIRPLVLIYLLLTYTLFSLVSMGESYLVKPAYVELLAQMLMLVMGAYFAGRTIEKGISMVQSRKDKESDNVS